MPTEAEIQAQWQNGVDCLEEFRAFADNTLAAASGPLDTLAQSFEGQYIPIDGAAFISRMRALASSAIDPSQARAILDAVLFEYANILAGSATVGYGSGRTSPVELARALYDWLHENSDTVASRVITYATPSANGSNVGNLTVERLTEDAKGYNLEACHVEKKMLRCVVDQNTGANEWAERFEISGEQASFDAVRYGAFGSGDSARTVLTARHAGSGQGGSLLNNSSFSNFTASASSGEQFDNWTETLGGGAAYTDITQDTSNVYRSFPNEQTSGALKIAMDNAADSVYLKQTLSQMKVSRLDPSLPYFLRVMWNRSVGSGAGGSVHLKLGGNTAVTVALAAQSGWQELVIPFDSTCWPENFSEDGFDVEIGWAGGTSGYVLFDDAIFAPWTLVDGTYWLLNQKNASPAPSIVNDEYYAVDSGGAPGTGKLQYWFWRAGYGYLPSSNGANTIADPS